jgi:hypothetical protein
MSKNHEGDIKQYTHLAEAWYAKTNLADVDYVDNVTFGFYSPGGGTSGEMGVRWYQIDGPVPKLECFNDGWHALAQLKDVIDALAELDDEDITPEDFCKLLDRCGFVDDTPRKYEDSYPRG